MVPASGQAWPISERLAMRVWLAESADGEPVRTADHDELRWLSAGELFDVPWLPADTELVRALADLLAE